MDSQACDSNSLVHIASLVIWPKAAKTWFSKPTNKPHYASKGLHEAFWPSLEKEKRISARRDLCDLNATWAESIKMPFLKPEALLSHFDMFGWFWSWIQFLLVLPMEAGMPCPPANYCSQPGEINTLSLLAVSLKWQRQESHQVFGRALCTASRAASSSGKDPLTVQQSVHSEITVSASASQVVLIAGLTLERRFTLPFRNGLLSQCIKVKKLSSP